jgi:hypothetical protein
MNHLVETGEDIDFGYLVRWHQRKFYDYAQVEQAEQDAQPLGEGEDEFDHGGFGRIKDKG